MRRCLRETRRLERAAERRKGLGLRYFAPWLREAQPGNMDTFLRNDIGFGDWASAEGSHRSGCSESESPFLFLGESLLGGTSELGTSGVACPPIEPWSKA